jgi:predicted metal-dependent peptidase
MKNITPDERLKNLVAKMTLKSSYWGYLFSRIRREESESIPSIMGVKPNINGTITLVFHPKLLMGTEDSVLKQIIEHEGMHVLNKHISRLLRILSNEVSDMQKMRKAIIWNIAADCSVNHLIDLPKTLKIDGKDWPVLHPKMYKLPDNKPTEFYFKELLKQDEKNKKNGGGECAEGLKSVGKSMDDHSEWKNITKQSGDVSALSRSVDNYIQDLIKDSLKNFERGRGDLPAYIRELIDKALRPPKAPYFMIIRKLVKASRYSKFKRAFAKVSRKRTYTFMIGENSNLPAISPFPGRARDLTFDIIVVIDVSGSMSPDDIKEGLSGVRNVIEGDRFCKLTVMEIDTVIQKEYQVKKVKDIDFEVKGRGGTVLAPALERCKKLNPDVVLCFTDGYTDNINGMPKKYLPKKIIYVIQKGGTADNVNKTGYVVRIDG